MWNDIVTLYIDDVSVRLLVINSNRIRKWAEIKLEPGLIEDGVVLNETEVANRIRQLIKTQEVRHKNIILGYSGLHSLTRPGTLPQLPKTMLSEAVLREARRVLPVQLDQLYLSWCILPGPKSRTRIFLAATPRKTADSLIKTIKAAGLNPTRMALKPLALTKALPENTAILIDIQPSEFDIVIMVEGISQPVRTVTFPNGELTSAQKIDLIASDLDRTIKFFDTNNPEKPLDVTAQIYVSGELIGQPELQAALAKKAGRKVIPLTTLLKGAEQVDTGRYMANIAMALNSPASLRWNTFPAANLNVLPAPYLPKPISLTKVAGIPAGIAVAGVAIAMLVMSQNYSGNISSLQKNLDTTNLVYNQKVLQKQNLKKTVSDLDNEVAIIKKNYQKIQGSVDSIAAQQESVNGDLAAALGWPDTNINLTGIHEANHDMVIEGTSSNELNVLYFARYLDKTGRFSSTTVNSFVVSDITATQAPGTSNNIAFIISLQGKGK